MYKIIFRKAVEKDLVELDNIAYNKVMKLIKELSEHPRTGTGKPERLKWQDREIWSRRISQKHRLIYAIEEAKITVLILSVYGHYDDK